VFLSQRKYNVILIIAIAKREICFW